MSTERDNRNYSAIQYSDAITPIIMDICYPLEQIFGINFFAYQKYFYNARYLSLSNNPEINRYYIQFIEGISEIFQEAIKNTEDNKPYYFLWPNSFQNLSHSEEVILSKLHSSNIRNGFTVYKREKNIIESWSFASTISNNLMVNFYLNNLDKIHWYRLSKNMNAIHLLEEYLDKVDLLSSNGG